MIQAVVSVPGFLSDRYQYLIERSETMKILIDKDDASWADAIAVCAAPEAVPGFAGDLSFTVETSEIIGSDLIRGDYAEEDIIGVFRTADGRFVALWASCDTTGWDCQAGGRIRVAASLESLIRFGLTDEDRERLGIGELTDEKG